MRTDKHAIDRRHWLNASGAAILGAASSSWLGRVATAFDDRPRPKRSCLLLWMNGGPSQTDTFDLKSGHAHGGPFQPIATSSPDLMIGEHLPEVAKWMHRLAVIRSMSTREGDHGRARDHLRSGYLPQGPIRFPVLGSLVSHEYGSQSGELPHYVSILPRGLFRAGIPPAGFLGSEHAPLRVGSEGANDGGSRLAIEDLTRPAGVSPQQLSDRVQLLQRFESRFLADHPGPAAEGHRSAYGRSLKLMEPSAVEAFELAHEPDADRDRYGRTQFGQGCLLARRLIERRVPFVEVTLGGWDTHVNNFPAVQDLCGTLDRAWSSLMQDLDQRGLLESTVVVWMGEFGRTPVINPQSGRDHYPKAWSVALGGGGIQGGAVLGRTSADGLTVEDRPVAVPDLLATILLAMGLDPQKQNMSNVGRPIRLADPGAQPVREILA
jgi:hypothetical protein